ncbi:Crp/Fnr family transcriptional regulator [Mucilaginibacter sp. UR6-11]|uniref:Crp/Fnr family transcriptional regulator n=1 Tax=Mucilaginibacter sp. UR6-11 TaxID=1435644 RepID=UPI001E42DF88|nr:Crp/Fnr family transcriptional regulator [Mucilaginibacter sp. UR6-11]MCC8423664.1 Crp/Fnr family transcriptional regulator [Mucilaginibacter sp. UR6-11]
MENQPFFDALLGIHFFTEEVKNSFNNIVKKKTFPTHHILLRTGEVCKKIWFIEDGFAMSHIVKVGKKIPVLFWEKNDIVIPVRSFLKQLPSELNIELLEKSSLSFISYDDFNNLMQKYPETIKYFQNKIEGLNYVLEKRVVDLISTSVEQRYQLILTNSPNIILKTPVELVASYLGVSRKTLNRVRTAVLRKH